MGYDLGVDLGTTYTAAAIARGGRSEIVTLGTRTAAVPSVLWIGEDDTVLTGDAANRRGLTEPDRVAREFKRRVGDPTPILVGGTPMSAEALMAKLLRWTVDQVRELEGEEPGNIAVCHPANWGPYKKDLLQQAVRLAGFERATTLTEPEAAAFFYAASERVSVGDLVAVYDLGGGTFDVAVLRRTEGGFEILGDPEGVERLGGIDIDEAVFGHVRRALGPAWDALDPDDPTVVQGVARLRQECVEAKEALSQDTAVEIPVSLPGIQREVVLTRDELEGMIRPLLSETVSALERGLRGAGIQPTELAAVLLVGGSSRIPLVARMTSAALGRPVAVNAHPKHAIALGAALAATAFGGTSTGTSTGAAGSAPPRLVINTGGPAPAAPNRTPIIAGAVVLVLALLAAAFFLTQGGGGETPPTTVAAGATVTTQPANPRTEVTGITIKNEIYLVTMKSNYDYRAFGGPGTFRPHVYFGAPPGTAACVLPKCISDEQNAGAGGPTPGDVQGWGRDGFTVQQEDGSWVNSATAFDGWKVSDRPPGSDQMCVIVVAADTKVVIPGSGNCVPLPG